MADIVTLINQARAASPDLMNDPRLQFGTTDEPRLLATVLPEITIDDNKFDETRIRFRSPIANAGDRYSGVQLKGGATMGTFLVETAFNNIGSKLEAREFDAITRMLQRRMSIEAFSTLIRFLDTTVTNPLLDINELWRSQVLCSALLQARGDNGYAKDITYYNPAGHRAAAGGVWGNDAYDPFDDILNRKLLLASKGFGRIARIITGSDVTSIMAGNAKVQTRAGRVRVQASNGAVSVVGGAPSLADINRMMQEDGLPPIEVYDRMYQTSNGTAFFLPRGTMLFIAATGETRQVGRNPDDIRDVANTLGYTGIGTPAGHAAPGRKMNLNPRLENHPYHVESEGVQETAIVVQEPEAIATIHTIAAS